MEKLQDDIVAALAPYQDEKHTFDVLLSLVIAITIKGIKKNGQGIDMLEKVFDEIKCVAIVEYKKLLEKERGRE